MNHFLRQIIFSTLLFLTFNLTGQEGLLVVVGQIDSIKFDKTALRQLQIQDSIEYANGIWTHDTIEDGTVISTGPAQNIRMSNPYILSIDVQKSFSTSVNDEKLQIRVWEHEDTRQFFNPKEPFAFILTKEDSLGIHPTIDYYRVFKTSTGKWAEPVGTRKKVYPKAKKAFIKNELLKEFETDYYQLISDEQECCMQQLRQFYGLVEKEIKTEPNN